MNIQIFSGLRARLMLLVLLGAIPLLTLLVYSGFEQRKNTEADAQQDATHLVMKMMDEHQRLVKETRQLLVVLSKIQEIQNGDLAGCNELLASLQRETGAYVNLGVIRPNGDVVCSGIPLKKALNVKDRAYFQRALKNRDFSIGDYQIGRITNIAVLVFAYPVFNDQQQIKAVLFAALPLSWIKKHLTNFPLPPGSVVTVIDHSTHTLLAQYPESTTRIGSSVENSILVNTIHASGSEGAVEVTDLDGVERFYTFRRLANLPGGKEIYINLDIPMAVVDARVNAVMVRNLAILIGVAALVLLFAWYGIYAMVMKQVTGLLAVTRRLAAGHLDARVEVSDSKNEISQLGREFNQMAIALERRDSEAIRVDYQLRKSEEYLRHVLETVPDIIYTATTSNNFSATFISPALTRILGFAPDEFVKDPDQWAANIHDEDREHVITQMQSALNNTEDDFRTEYRMWHKDGKTFRWFDDRAHITRDAEGHATAIYGVMTDITKQKQAESLSVRLGRILEGSWSEIYVFDATTLRFIDVSNGACQNLGYSIDELKQLTPLDLKSNLTPGQFEARLGPLRRGEKPQVTFETEHRRKDGSHYPVEVNLQLSSTEIPPVFITIIQDISERKRYIADLEHKSMFDALTDLPNRLLFLDRLKHALKVARREASPLAVLTVDVVRLREVNDILGHEAGDHVLQEVACHLQKTLRESDTVARLGGDEFAIVLPNVGMRQISVAVRKIQKLLQQPAVFEGTSLEIEVAVGIALYPEHGDEPDILLQHADIAMQVAKNEARGFSIYNVDNDPYSLRKLQLLGELRKAIENKELALYYQPQIDLQTGQIVSVEALARWPHPVEGVISPDDFIPMIEQSGLIRPFTFWVLEEAVVQLKYWSEAGIDLTIAVNLSTRNLIDSRLPGSIAKLLNVHNVSAENLTLEVTESAVMSRPEMALKVLTQLHKMGHKLSIDDFGTGYSSLSYLKKLPVHELKIDKSFVLGLTTNDDDAVIVRSIIHLANNMGLKVVAEGVEDQDILDMLAILKCDIAQGYHMSHPLPVEELEQWLIDSPWGLKKDGI